MKKSQKVDDYIAKSPEWQQRNLKAFRKAVNAYGQDVIEDIKWNVPVYMLGGKVILAMSSFKKHTKYNFFNGYLISNDQLFNSGLDSKISRSINLEQGDKVDEMYLKKIVKESLSLAETGD